MKELIHLHPPRETGLTLCGEVVTSKTQGDINFVTCTRCETTHEKIINGYPDHPMRPPIGVWLVQEGGCGFFYHFGCVPAQYLTRADFVEVRDTKDCPRCAKCSGSLFDSPLPATEVPAQALENGQIGKRGGADGH